MADGATNPPPAPRPRGAPRGRRVEPHTSVSVWLPVREHERLLRIANRHYDGSISKTIRTVLIIRRR